MAKRTGKRHPVLRATLWFALVMLPSWWVLVLALTGHGCSFEPSSIGKHPPVPQAGRGAK